MKKVLYLSNMAVPYRVRFFNELAKHVCLTVVYETPGSGSRNSRWAKSEKPSFRVRYRKIGMVREVLGNYDHIIVGCCNSPYQLLAMLVMNLCRIPYILNLDGEQFLENKGLKNRLKRIALSGAAQYLVAGEQSARSLTEALGDVRVIPYYFSSLTEQELENNRQQARDCRGGHVLVVGQYFPYKGLDVALEAARMDLSISYRFVGMSARTDRFLRQHRIPENVQIIPFLQKQDLEREYRDCALLVLPSRQECWGLVVNEAASFGTPIVSTWGSGAAVEFLGDSFPEYLAKPDDSADLLRCIRSCLAAPDREEYSVYLLEKSRHYHIQKSVQAHLEALS